MSLLCPFHIFKQAEAIAKNRVVQVVGGVALLAAVARRISAARNASAFAASVKENKSGVVYIYSYPRLLAKTPSLSHNATKIEAFLRVNKIPYVCKFMSDVATFSPTETAPFVAIDGELVGESHFCVDAIAKKFNVNDFDSLSPAEQAKYTMVRRLVDNSMNWHVSRTLTVDNFQSSWSPIFSTASKVMGAPEAVVRFMFRSLRKSYIKTINATGLGWLSDERYLIELERDVRALSALIEESQKAGKKYLFGDKPTGADCLIFSFLSATAARPEPSVNAAGVKLMREDPVLVGFVSAFEAEYFADIDKIAPSTMEQQSFTA